MISEEHASSISSAAKKKVEPTPIEIPETEKDSQPNPDFLFTIDPERFPPSKNDPMSPLYLIRLKGDVYSFLVSGAFYLGGRWIVDAIFRPYYGQRFDITNLCLLICAVVLSATHRLKRKKLDILPLLHNPYYTVKECYDHWNGSYWIVDDLLAPIPADVKKRWRVKKLPAIIYNPERRTINLFGILVIVWTVYPLLWPYEVSVIVEWTCYLGICFLILSQGFAYDIEFTHFANYDYIITRDTSNEFDVRYIKIKDVTVDPIQVGDPVVTVDERTKKDQ
jgi:hypothetical protein